MTLNNFTVSDIADYGLSDAPGFKGQIVRDLVDQHFVAEMIQGENYYNNVNDIKARKLYYWENGVQVEDELKTNNTLSHNWHKLLVDQKSAYLCGKPISFLAAGDGTAEKQFANIINDVLEDDFDDEAAELIKEASNKGLSWLHLYIDKIEKGIGKFKYMKIPSEEVIGIWDTVRQKELVEVIRYYTMTDANGDDFIKAEWWTANDVTYFVEIKTGGEFVLDPDYETNPAPHYYKNGKGAGWGKVPFACFKNNEECKNDLTFYKELIDIYDLINSDIANDFSEIQKLIMIIKGYDGSDNKELLENLRYHKLIKVSEGGGIDTLAQDIPITAFNEFANRLEENIFLFGQGVNVKSNEFGNATGVALKFLYGLLDLKSGIVERKFRKGLRDVIEFVAMYEKIALNKTYDPAGIKIVFNKSMILNELEMVTMAQTSKGVISDDTIIANHPWVEDPAAEMKKLKESQKTIDLDEGKNE